MGVTGLWTVVQPCARPIKLETLNKKRLAVDASIWIYQFLKAVRDKEGNALRNSHVVGFFRRICKLLFFGIKPVFVFDGGAPALKRQTISGRKARREGRREDAVRTAGKLLAVQMQRRAEEAEVKRKEERDRTANTRLDEQEEEVPDNLVYVEEQLLTEKERQQNRTFRKKDAYHLPDLDVSLSEMGAPNDPRIMSQAELEEYARQFHTGEDINLYDFSKIDFNGPFFMSLPASDRYNILNAARLRSRLRMGYSKEQLDTMFPDRMAFSRFQIERVAERNELTQRLMNINGMNGEDAVFGVGGRVAGEKGKEYVLVKNDGVEGGWALGVVSNKNEGQRNKPIDIDRLGRPAATEEDDGEESEDGFEDVPIEGLNRLPKRHLGRAPVDSNDDYESAEVIQKRRTLYEARKQVAVPGGSSLVGEIDEDPESLFLPVESDRLNADEENDDLFEDVPAPVSDGEDDLQRAIAMSLEAPNDDSAMHEAAMLNGPPIDRPLEFNAKNAKAGRAFAHMTNARALGSAPSPLVEGNEENEIDLQAALAESRNTKYRPHGGSRVYGKKDSQGLQSSDKSVTNDIETAPSPPTKTSSLTTNGFDGPLPFESLNLGQSLFTKKKKPADEEGGFQKEPEQKAKPIPPWFTADIRKELAAQKEIEDRQFDGSNPQNRPRLEDKVPVLRKQKTGEVIDLDARKDTTPQVIEVESSEDEKEDVIADVVPVDSELRMEDIADLIRAEPPISTICENGTISSNETERTRKPTEPADEEEGHQGEDEPLEWDESDLEEERSRCRAIEENKPLGGKMQPPLVKPPSPEFENVGIPGSPSVPQSTPSPLQGGSLKVPALQQEDSFDRAPDVDMPLDNEDVYSDPEDEELLHQLAIEAEEHARFAATLNSKSQIQNAEDYERELRQLRNQQKKDRRDADEVSHIMVTECQQLLKLFGLPYITAPMEAEAQCAELVSLGLVDGIVTDDSDIFLFGGTRVYKNMFNAAKFVECYLASDLEKEYSLDRYKVIQIAHLLGSDYTEGLPSVGPVTALEILSEFENLEAFRDWWLEVQKGHKFPEDNASPFRKKFKRNATKLFLPPAFPDKRVDQAYLLPEVDSDPSPFAWGVPDLDALRGFLMATIGWTQERADEILVPVIRDMNRRENEGTQANITQFFSGTVGVGGREKGNAYAPRRRVEGKSRRMENALGRLHDRARKETVGEDEGGVNGEEANSPVGFKGTGNEDIRESRTKKSRTRKRTVQVEDASSESADDDEEYKAPKRTKRRKAGAKARKATGES